MLPMSDILRRQRSQGARSFWGQKILQPSHPDAFFSSKKVGSFFSCRPQKTGRQCRFTVKIKQIKRSDMVTFLFSVHTITEAKQYAGLQPGWWIFQPMACPGVTPPLDVYCASIFTIAAVTSPICKTVRHTHCCKSTLFYTADSSIALLCHHTIPGY